LVEKKKNKSQVIGWSFVVTPCYDDDLPSTAFDGQQQLVDPG
jgi:hypothetical protein